MARRLWENLGTLLLAFLLAVLVWVVAVNEENPVEARTLTQVPVELVGKPEDMMIIGSVMTTTQVSVSAPRLTLGGLTARDVRVTADLSGLEPGTHPIRLQYTTTEDNVSIRSVEPETISVTLERSAVRQMPVDVTVLGEPAAGYEAEAPQLSTDTVTVSGPSSAVGRVASIMARLSIADLRGDYRAPSTSSQSTPTAPLSQAWNWSPIVPR